ncbi:MAG: hypothetical protein CfClM3_1007 [Methanobrevibacter sp. CfCl-M3]
MNSLKCRAILAIFTIFLVVSLNFVPAVNASPAVVNNTEIKDPYAVDTDIGNSTNTTNTTNSTNATNSSTNGTLQNVSKLFNVTYALPVFNAPFLGGLDKIKKQFMKKPEVKDYIPVWNPPRYNPPNKPSWNPPRVYKGWKIWKTIADTVRYLAYVAWYTINYAIFVAYTVAYGVAYALYAVAYGLAVIGGMIAFLAVYIAYFFANALYVFYAVPMLIANFNSFINIFKSIGSCFKPDITFTNRTATINKTIEVLVNNTNITSNNSSNETNFINDMDIDKYFANITLGSGSNGSYENATDKDLKDHIDAIDINKKSIKKGFDILDLTLSSISTVIDLVDWIIGIVSAISASLAAPTEGGSVTTAAATQVTKLTLTEVVEKIVEDLLKKAVQDLTQYAVKFCKDMINATNSNDTYGNYSKFGAESSSKIYDIIKTILDIKGAFGASKDVITGVELEDLDVGGEKLEVETMKVNAPKTDSGIVKIIKLFMTVTKLLFKVAYLVLEVKLMKYTCDMQAELDYRSANNITY